ncbi:high mobility group [Dipsacomyces acuminosporus]|nr:high mobility group [Dipsacomyces acuminosporus]
MKPFMAHSDSASAPKPQQARHEYIGIPEQVSSSSSEGGPVRTSSTLSTSPDYSTSALRFHALASRFDSSANAMACEGEVIADMIAGIGCHFRRYSQLVAGIHSTFQGLSRLCMEKQNEARQCIADTATHYMVEPVRSDSRYSSKPPSGILSRRNTSAIQPFSPSTPALPARQIYRAKLGAKTRKAAGTSLAKRPLSDFNFFCRDARRLVVEAHPEYTKELVNKELGRIWSVLDRDSRQYYRSMYIQDKLRYTRDAAALSHSSAMPKPPPKGHPDGVKNTSGEAEATNSTAPTTQLLVTGLTDTRDQVKQTIWRCATSEVHSLPLLLPTDGVHKESRGTHHFATASSKTMDAPGSGEVDEQPLAHAFLNAHTQPEQASCKPSIKHFVDVQQH